MDTQSLSVFAAIVTAMAAVIVAPLVHLYLGIRQTAAAKASAEAALLSARSAGQHSVCCFRQEWINSLRKDLAAFHSIMMTTVDYPYSPEVDQSLCELGTRIELSINPTEDMARRLIMLVYAMYECGSVQE